MSLQRLSAVMGVFVFFLSIPCFSQIKNRVAVAEDDRLKLYEFNSSSNEFDLVWESADFSSKSHSGSLFRDLHIIDVDDDGKCVLCVFEREVMEMGGKNGTYPQKSSSKHFVSC